MDELKIIETEDGSHSLYNPELKETYHSTHGAIQESNHVFIQNGLDYYHKLTGCSHINVFEIGFGTGLNALLSQQFSGQHVLPVLFHTIEPFPIPSHIISKLNYRTIELEEGVFDSLHSAPFSEMIQITKNFQFQKERATLQGIQVDKHENQYDVVFYDAFAPSKQPELWVKSCFEKLKTMLKTKGVLVTYCAKGQLKRDLSSLGFEVQTLPGPPGKREMIRAILK